MFPVAAAAAAAEIVSMTKMITSSKQRDDRDGQLTVHGYQLLIFPLWLAKPIWEFPYWAFSNIRVSDVNRLLRGDSFTPINRTRVMMRCRLLIAVRRLVVMATDVRAMT